MKSPKNAGWNCAKRVAAENTTAVTKAILYWPGRRECTNDVLPCPLSDRLRRERQQRLRLMVSQSLGAGPASGQYGSA